MTYDASAAPDPAADISALLLGMQSQDADRRLLDLLDSVDDLVAAGQARDAGDAFDPALGELLEAVTSAHDAPFEFRELNRRVHSGSLSWQQVWLAPQDEPGGYPLIQAAMRLQATQSADILRRLEADDEGGGEGLLR